MLSALIGENPYKPEKLFGGLDLLVPLRCACPTKNQTQDGTKYLMTYSLNENDNLSDLSERFNVSDDKVGNANGFVDPDPVVYPSTTVLIPLPRKPLSSQTQIYHPLEYSPPPRSCPIIRKAKRLTTGLHVGIGAAISVAVLFLIVTVLLWLRRKKMKRMVMKNNNVVSKDIANAVSIIDCPLKIFLVEEIKEATKYFSSECRIQGSVYKGIIGENVSAIKKISKDMSQEVNILHKLNHVNIISLHGICTGEENCYLVYEFMENGSLKDWLKNPNRSGLLKWTQKVQIALDIANGLDYIHNFTYPPYIHKDITSSNVLLNGKLRAKITNFTLARSSDCRKSGSYLTKNVEGTLGYMAPEFIESGLITPKLDVYAFGVVISELITGKKAINVSKGREELLSESIVSIVEGNNADRELMGFMESTMRSISPVGLVTEVAKLCVACLARDPERRPSMHQVVSVLTRVQVDSQMWALAYQ
ncbi:protein LYK5-like [Asparagus officinalis]|uniref:protein LYK5-like n=1 Tax=Asparagus officinalis TaxID=4686 RepID=UPI00098E004E|nr:protein LYK5-like [Asparagus officinalis]